MTREQKMSRFLLIVVVVANIFLDFWSYSQAYYREPQYFAALLRGEGDAPQQYRVGVLQLANGMSHLLHFGLRHGLALVDLLSALVAVFVLLHLVESSATYRGASRVGRWLASASVIVLVQYYLTWLLWFQRPETLTTAATLSVLLWMMSPTVPGRSDGGRVLLVAGTVVVAFLQSLVRADVVITLEGGVLLLCLAGRAGREGIGRWWQAAASALALLTAGGVQYYLMHVRYRSATYGSTPVFQLWLNLKDPIRLVPFSIVLLPTAWVLWRLSRRGRSRLDGVEAASAGMIPGMLMFVGLWWVLGRVDEVRIVMPYALAMVPITTLLLLRSVEAEA